MSMRNEKCASVWKGWNLEALGPNDLARHVFAELAGEIERLQAIIERDKANPVHRLHNLVDALSDVQLRPALETLIREASAVADDHHRPRYTRLDEALTSAREALRVAL